MIGRKLFEKAICGSFVDTKRPDLVGPSGSKSGVCVCVRVDGWMDGLGGWDGGLEGEYDSHRGFHMNEWSWAAARRPAPKKKKARDRKKVLIRAGRGGQVRCAMDVNLATASLVYYAVRRRR